MSETTNYNEMAKTENKVAAKVETPVAATSSPVEKKESRAIVAVHKLYIREKATRKSAQVTTLTKGVIVTLTGEKTGEWVGVKTKDGKAGFVMDRFVRVIK